MKANQRATVSGIRLGLTAAIVFGLAGLPAAAAPAAGEPTRIIPPVTVAATGHLFGDYLAGRSAQQHRDFSAAVGWYEKAIAGDPDSPELISRTFLMELSVGHFDKARALSGKALKLDPSDALPQLVLLTDRLKSGDKEGALKAATALPQDGLHRFVTPIALAWARMANGDIAGADTALQGLDKFNGFQPLKEFQLGLLYDFANEPAKAGEHYDKALAAAGQINWRLADAIGNFRERHGQEKEAKELYDRFMHENAGSELAQSVLAARQPGPPPPIVSTPADGLGEGLFDLASVLNQGETADLALVYDRFAIELKPNFALAQLLLADLLSSESKPQESLSVLASIPAASPYHWSARLRIAADLEALNRVDEAIAMLKDMSAQSPNAVGAELQLGDLLRAKKRFAEAVEAYDEAIRRTTAAGLPVRWVMYYDRGVALERSHQWQRAEADLEHALELKPNQPLVLNYLGYSWIDRGENLDRGLKMIEKAVELRPEDGYIIDSLGWAHFRMGDYAGAVKYLEKAVELVPEDPTVNDHLGDAYWQTGRLTEARYQWRRALQFGPEEKEIKPIEAKLERGLTAPPAQPRGG